MPTEIATPDGVDYEEIHKTIESLESDLASLKETLKRAREMAVKPPAHEFLRAYI